MFRCKKIEICQLLKITIILIFYSVIQADRCGEPIGLQYRIEERIVSGYDIGYYKYPWFAVLHKDNIISCAGTLIGPRTILTSAHCYKLDIPWARQGDVNLTDIHDVHLGLYNICNNETNRRNYKVLEVIIHELYWEKKPYYDIAILVLDEDTDIFMPICLPPSNIVMRPKEGFVTGIGTIKYNGKNPCTVQEARLLIYPDDVCHKMLNSTGNKDNLIYNAFCAGYLQGGIDTCQGDSGGPLQVVGSKGHYFLLGIVSFGFHCAEPDLLGLYTDVSKYTDWINDKLFYIQNTYNISNSYGLSSTDGTNLKYNMLLLMVLSYLMILL